MCVYFGASGARHVRDQVLEVGGRLEFDFAVRGSGGTDAFDVAFVYCGSGHDWVEGLVVRWFQWWWGFARERAVDKRE